MVPFTGAFTPFISRRADNKKQASCRAVLEKDIKTRSRLNFGTRI
jgi:hypothetical protein